MIEMTDKIVKQYTKVAKSFRFKELKGMHSRKSALFSKYRLKAGGSTIVGNRFEIELTNERTALLVMKKLKKIQRSQLNEQISFLSQMLSGESDNYVLSKKELEFKEEVKKMSREEQSIHRDKLVEKFLSLV